MSESYRMNQGKVNPEPLCPGPIRSPPHTVPPLPTVFLLPSPGPGGPKKDISISEEEWRRSPLSNYLARGSCLYTMTNHSEATPLPLSVGKNRFLVDDWAQL